MGGTTHKVGLAQAREQIWESCRNSCAGNQGYLCAKELYTRLS